MLRAIGRTLLEIARAIDTGHAIRHGTWTTTSSNPTPRTAARSGATASAHDPETVDRPEPAH